MTTQQIAELVDGDLKGAGDVRITGVRPLEKAAEVDLSFVAKKSLLPTAASSRAGALLTAWPVEGYGGVQIVCPDPELALLRVLETVRNEQLTRPSGISETAYISPGAQLGKGVAVGHCAVIEEGAVLADDVVVYPLAYIGRGACIGARTIVYPHATICDGAQIGEDCTVHPNCVIGDDGFHYIQRDGRSLEMVHIGSVRIGNEVQIRGLSSVDRGMIDDTVLGDGVRLDKHCHVAHNCHLGDHCVLAGHAVMGGSVTLGKGVIVAGNAAISDHIEVGDGAVIAGSSGVTGDVKPQECVWGMPARPIEKQRRITAIQSRLPEMHQSLQKLEKKVESLEKRLAEIQ